MSSEFSGYVLDTHAILWHFAGNRSIGKRALEVMLDKSSTLYLPTIVLAEALWIIEKGRVDLTEGDFTKLIEKDRRIVSLDLSETIVRRAQEFRSVSEMHDRLIVSTTHFLNEADLNVALVTKDQNIVESGYVPTVWD